MADAAIFEVDTKIIRNDTPLEELRISTAVLSGGAARWFDG